MTSKEREILTEHGEKLAAQSVILERIETSVASINKCLVGNGKPGLLTRVDRLEVWDKTKNKVLWLLGGTTVGGFITWVTGKYLP